MTVIEPTTSLVVKRDASDAAIAAIYSQLRNYVAFFSRTLSSAERKYPAVEKEAYSIVEDVRKWRHHLIGSHFKLVTDQRSVFMYDIQHKSKIKNDKILRWRLELSGFHYDVVYRPGKQNLAADAFSRHCSAMSCDINKLRELHETLCHPGITCMLHFIRARNLPYSVSDVNQVVNYCRNCSELKQKLRK